MITSTDDLERSLTFGRVTLTIEARPDYDPDLSYLGTYSNWVRCPETYLYHRSSGLMWDGSFWRNELGRIQADPTEDGPRYRNEYEYIDIGTCQFKRSDKHSLKYAFQNAKRLDSYGNRWECVGLVATVELDGVEIGRYSVWGFDLNWCGPDRAYNSYLVSEARSIAREALAQAKTWQARNLTGAAS